MGGGIFFEYFIQNYSTLSDKLTDMTKKDFNWEDESTWKADYRKELDQFKEALHKTSRISARKGILFCLTRGLNHILIS